MPFEKFRTYRISDELDFMCLKKRQWFSEGMKKTIIFYLTISLENIFHSKHGIIFLFSLGEVFTSKEFETNIE